MRNVLLAPVRCLVLGLLSVAGLLMAEVVGVLVALALTYPYIVAGNRRLAQLGRRLSRDWCGVPITARYLPIPAEPMRTADGWYVHDNQLFKRPGFPRYLRRAKALSEDPSVLRDWLWLAFTPFTGGVAVLVPVALLLAGVPLLVLAPQPWGSVAAGASLALGVTLAPLMLRVYGRWSRILLQPLDESWWHHSGVGPWVKRQWWSVWHGAGLAGLTFGLMGFGLLSVSGLVLFWNVLGPQTMLLGRPSMDYFRRRSETWTGRAIASPYRPEPPAPRPDASGMYRTGRFLHRNAESAVRAQRNWSVLRDPASWRDLLWTLTAPLFGPLSIGLTALVAFAFFGLVWQPLWWAPWAVPIGLADGVWVTPWYMWYGLGLLWPPLAEVPGWLSPLIGLGVTGVVVPLAALVFRARCAYDRWLLRPTRAAVLAQRVHELTRTRSDATDAQAAEVRRIERDLHDGAQARLVAVGLSLATVERLLEQDPAAARAMLAQARETSATALTELRDLVRGIHPPVLAERGLGDAVRAVALDYPLPVQVSVAIDGRLDAPVESAAYFAVCEALTNATRHAGATRVTVDLRHTGERLLVTVVDDGRGGADPGRGTGLAGIGRRLGTFDGVLSVDSPAGGPTVLTMEVPCALSSPRTSTS
jgi:signal transduction histidine kinase